MIPHQCLGSVWSSKSRERDAATVVATIEQVSILLMIAMVLVWVIMVKEVEGGSQSSGKHRTYAGNPSIPGYFLLKTYLTLFFFSSTQ